jgi:hypothetical protein
MLDCTAQKKPDDLVERLSETVADASIVATIWFVPLSLLIWLAISSWRDRDIKSGLRSSNVFSIDQRDGQEQDHDRNR